MDMVYVRLYWNLQACGFSDSTAARTAYKLRVGRMYDAVHYLKQKGEFYA